MPGRFLFRQIDYRDIGTFLQDGEIRAKNHASPQRCYQTSYANLVNRRGTAMFQVPGGGVVNDYVAFYFSPYTSFTCSIHRGGVEVVDPSGRNLGPSRLDDRVFVVCRATDLGNAGLNCCYSDFALNSDAFSPTISSDLSQIETHVHWNVFDDYPLTASIPEVGYEGVCKYFGSRATPPKYQLRKEQRMAEFLVHSSVPLGQVACVVTPSDGMKIKIQAEMAVSAWNIPVYAKPGCFVQ
jgi:hypothetical protein